MTNITPEMQEVFNALTSGEHDNFALFSCFVNGEPTSAIVVVEEDGDDAVIIPIFVALTPSMKLTNHEGIEPGE